MTDKNVCPTVLARSRTPAVLALDIGSSGIRASLFDECGREVAGANARSTYQSVTSQSASSGYATNNLIQSPISNFTQSPTSDFATFHAASLLEQVAQNLDALLAKTSQATTRIELIAISCFWHSLVGVDASGRATTPVLGWADARAAAAVYELRSEFAETKTHARTGCRFHSSYWPAKLRRLRNEGPEIFAATTRWLSFAEYLSLHFFGETAMSVSMASGTGLLDQHTCQWDEELLRALGISITSLPEIAGPQQSFRSLTSSYAVRWPQLDEARLFPAVGDGAANSIGSGCYSTEKVALMIGTSGAMRVCFAGAPPDQLPPELWCYRANRERVLVGGALSDGGGLFQWLKETLLPTEAGATIERELELLGPDAHGLTVLPFWAGERSTEWNPAAHGAILGLSLQTLPIEILRAAMEAIAYRFALIARALAPFAAGATLVASGNALRSSPTWVQILADVLGRPLLVSELPEASMRGAALLALEAAGKIQSIEKISVPALVSGPAAARESVFEPNPKRHELYQAGLARQQRSYQKLFT